MNLSVSKHKSKFAFAKISIYIFAISAILSITFTTKLNAKPAGSKWVAPASADKLANPVKADKSTLSQGKTLYANNCLSCHGSKGKGDGPKSDNLEIDAGNFTTPEFVKESDGAIFWKTSEGRKPMPSFKKELSAQERWLIITYVREFVKKK